VTYTDRETGEQRPVTTRGKDGRPEPVFQTHWAPPAHPWTLTEAIEFEALRDARVRRGELAAPATTRTSAEQAAAEARQLAERAAEAAERAAALAQQAAREAAALPAVAPLPPAIAAAEATREKIVAARDAADKAALAEAEAMSAGVNEHTDPASRARRGLPIR
jgi:hypothetical protein